MFEFWTGSEDLPIWGFVIRAFIIYIYIFLILKVLGQRSIGTLHPLDFLFGVLIGDILGEPLSSGDMPLSGPIAAAALVSTLHLSLSYIALKTPRFRRIIEDEPIILIKKGQILRNQLHKTKITVENLLMDLRLKDTRLDEVDYAVLESNGQISLIKKAEYNSVNAQDLEIQKQPQGYPSVVIMDGHLIQKNLDKVGSFSWLKEELNKQGYQDVKDIFLCTVDESGQVYVSGKG